MVILHHHILVWVQHHSTTVMFHVDVLVYHGDVSGWVHVLGMHVGG